MVFLSPPFYFVEAAELPAVSNHSLVHHPLKSFSLSEVDLQPQGGSLDLSEGAPMLGTL